MSSLVFNVAEPVNIEGIMDHKSNFEFLKEHDPVFFQLASAAEQAFAGDPTQP